MKCKPIVLGESITFISYEFDRGWNPNRGRPKFDLCIAYTEGLITQAFITPTYQGLDHGWVLGGLPVGIEEFRIESYVKSAESLVLSGGWCREHQTSMLCLYAPVGAWRLEPKFAVGMLWFDFH
jgi:hypothetical protein